jgi:hypothetical protein
MTCNRQNSTSFYLTTLLIFCQTVILSSTNAFATAIPAVDDSAGYTRYYRELVPKKQTQFRQQAQISLDTFGNNHALLFEFVDNMQQISTTKQACSPWDVDSSRTISPLDLLFWTAVDARLQVSFFYENLCEKLDQQHSIENFHYGAFTGWQGSAADGQHRVGTRGQLHTAYWRDTYPLREYCGGSTEADNPQEQRLTDFLKTPTMNWDDTVDLLNVVAAMAHELSFHAAKIDQQAKRQGRAYLTEEEQSRKTKLTDEANELVAGTMLVIATHFLDTFGFNSAANPRNSEDPWVKLLFKHSQLQLYLQLAAGIHFQPQFKGQGQGWYNPLGFVQGLKNYAASVNTFYNSMAEDLTSLEETLFPLAVSAARKYAPQWKDIDFMAPELEWTFRQAEIVEGQTVVSVDTRQASGEEAFMNGELDRQLTESGVSYEWNAGPWQSAIDQGMHLGSYLNHLRLITGRLNDADLAFDELLADLDDLDSTFQTMERVFNNLVNTAVADIDLAELHTLFKQRYAVIFHTDEQLKRARTNQTLPNLGEVVETLSEANGRAARNTEEDILHVRQQALPQLHQSVISWPQLSDSNPPDTKLLAVWLGSTPQSGARSAVANVAEYYSTVDLCVLQPTASGQTVYSKLQHAFVNGVLPRAFAFEQAASKATPTLLTHPDIGLCQPFTTDPLSIVGGLNGEFRKRGLDLAEPQFMALYRAEDMPAEQSLFAKPVDIIFSSLIEHARGVHIARPGKLRVRLLEEAFNEKSPHWLGVPTSAQSAAQRAALANIRVRFGDHELVSAVPADYDLQLHRIEADEKLLVAFLSDIPSHAPNPDLVPAHLLADPQTAAKKLLAAMQQEFGLSIEVVSFIRATEFMRIMEPWFDLNGNRAAFDAQDQNIAGRIESMAKQIFPEHS